MVGQSEPLERPKKSTPHARADRAGTKTLTAHVAEDIHAAMKEFTARENLTIDEAVHVGLALLLSQNGYQIPLSLDQKLKRHRLTSYVPKLFPG